MSHKRHPRHSGVSSLGTGEGQPLQKALRVVLKADTRGTLEAVAKALTRVDTGEVPIEIIESGVGDVSKGDLTMAVTGSRLVVGFDVGVLPRCDEFAREHGVEVRLYNLVDHLARDLGELARSLVPAAPRETILGQARVVALFKSTRKGIILGCEVTEGKVALGMTFRVISIPGTVYVGKVLSLHVGEDAVTQARPGQQVGLKVDDFKQARVGDLVECFEVERPRSKPWVPSAGVVRVTDR